MCCFSKEFRAYMVKEDKRPSLFKSGVCILQTGGLGYSPEGLGSRSLGDFGAEVNHLHI